MQKGLTLNGQYTYSKSSGNSAGSNEATTVGNNAVKIADFDYDNGYNRFDVRHTYNASMLLNLPIGKDRALNLGPLNAIFGNMDLGLIFNGRSGLPIDVLVTRPDVAYVDASGAVFGAPAAGRTAVINTPGGGASRNTRRPNLVPGVDPYLKNGLQWLNPAAFSIPAPGQFGNLKRGDIRGPSIRQLDLTAIKKINLGRSHARHSLRGLQPPESQQLRESLRHHRQRHRSRDQPGAAQPGAHPGRRGKHVRSSAFDGRDHGGPGHQSPDPTRRAREFLGEVLLQPELDWAGGVSSMEGAVFARVHNAGRSQITAA